MASPNNKARELRQIAEDLIDQLKENPEIEETDFDGLPTSLVRQWMTNDGIATLFLDGNQLFFTLKRSPLGALSVSVEPHPHPWVETLMEEWDVSEDEIPNIMHQMNLGQSAEFLNQQGEKIVWWVKPKDRSSLMQKPPPANDPEIPLSEGLLNAARRSLQDCLCRGIPEEEIPTLANSVVKQWEMFDGKSAIFTEKLLIIINMSTLEDGRLTVLTDYKPINCVKILEKLGVPSNEVWMAISWLNLGKGILFKGKDGNVFELFYDPRSDAFESRKPTNRIS